METAARPSPSSFLRRVVRAAFAAALGLFVVTAGTPAPGGEDDLDVGRKLAEAGDFARARQVFESIVSDREQTNEAKGEARYGLALLGRDEAFAAVRGGGSTYAEVVALFDGAVVDLVKFVQKDPKNPRALQATIDVGTTRLAFARWARELLGDPAVLAGLGFGGTKLAADARNAVTVALNHFGRLRPRPDDRDPAPLRQLASYYHGVSLYYRGLVEPPCSPAAEAALEVAVDDLEEYVMDHDGQLLAVYARDVLGLVCWELAKCATDREKQLAKYSKAFAWFETCARVDDAGPDHLRVITSGYQHLAQVALDAGRFPERHFPREALRLLDGMLDVHPTAWRTDDGLRALVELSKLECKRGNASRAIHVASDAARRAEVAGRPHLVRLANRQLHAYATGGCGTKVEGVSADVSRRVGDVCFQAGALAEAIEAYRAVVSASTDSPEDFLAHRWHAWKRMAEAHASLGQPLAEALAYEAVHEAWMAGRIPHDRNVPEGDANRRRAAADRRACEAAYRRAAESIGSDEASARGEAIRSNFEREYPGCTFDSPPEGPAGGEAIPAGGGDHLLAGALGLELGSVGEGAEDTPTGYPGGGGRQRAKAAVEDALKWLAAHQSPDGGWDCDHFHRWCDGKPSARGPDGLGQAVYDPGVTGLALCAFLGAGYTNRGRHPFARTVSRGLRYLKGVQDAEGCIGPRTSERYVYSHATAALAMVDAFGRTGSAVLRAPAQKALDFTALARNPYYAWRYGVKPGDNDTSVTGWMMMALQSAKLVNEDAKRRGKPAPLVVDEEAFDGIQNWVDKMTDNDYGRVGYIQRGGLSSRYVGYGEGFPRERSESITGVGMLARIFVGEDPRTSKMVKLGANLCVGRPPSWNPRTGSIDMYYWYYATLALSQVGGPHWKTWNEALKTAVVDHQRKDTTHCMYKGSWDPIGVWGKFGGRVYSTALLAMCLQVHYRYPKVFGTQR